MRYLKFVLIICIILALPITLCGCIPHPKSQIKVMYKSRVPKALKKTASGVIDLSDGRKVNFGANLGPTDPSAPNFDFGLVDKY